ncbi:MAG: GTP 3',8-cyclase MoaA [Acidobacteriota bacterium]
MEIERRLGEAWYSAPVTMSSPASVRPSDRLDRPLEDLRVSVTDRCNFRCGFCMPADRRYEFLPRPEVLTFEEIERLVGLFVDLGVRKVRLTGGEPLLRADIETLVRKVASVPGVDDLALTTNGWLLGEKARVLQEAGLDRVTVSLHSLDREVFARSNGLGLPLHRVLAGIEAARAAGLDPVKLNAVITRGENEHEIVDLARYAREHGCVIRFIEYMDVGTINSWDAERVVSAQQIIERIDAVYALEPLDKEFRGEVAARWRYRDGGGEIGVIPSITQPFCGDCTRARLTADGRLFTCLFGAIGHDLKGPLRRGEDDEALHRRIAAIWSARTDRYSEERTEALRAGRFEAAPKVEMFRIGG